MEVDVGIIGAGPAGSTLAALLARRGVGVALIDRDVFPRDKLCGEFLSYDALPILDAIGLTGPLADLGAATIDRCRVVSDGQRFEFDLPAHCRGISRLAFDRLLFDTAVSCGALPLAGWNADLENGKITLRRNGETQELKCRTLVGSWGRWGRFDQLLGRPFVRERAHRYFGFKRHYRGELDPNVIELRSFRRGYLGIATIEGGMTNICGLVHHSRLRGLKGGWPRFTAELAAEEQSLGALFEKNQPVDAQFLSSEPVIFVPKSPVENDIFLIGDAAGVIDPLTGNGMAIALQSALVAAPHVVASLSGLKSAKDRYADRFFDFFGSRLRWSRRIAYLLSRPQLLKTMLRTHPPAAMGRYLVGRTRADRLQLDRLVQQWLDSV